MLHLLPGTAHLYSIRFCHQNSVIERGRVMANSPGALILFAAWIGLVWPMLTYAGENGPPDGRRIALSGYDPVSYFEDSGPAKGSREFWFAYDDVVYIFRSAEHRAQFAADPERYAPQYAGYCAGGVSRGLKVEPNPEAWLIANGKLYMVLNKDRVSYFKSHIDDVAGKANSNWPILKSQ